MAFPSGPLSKTEPFLRSSLEPDDDGRRFHGPPVNEDLEYETTEMKPYRVTRPVQTTPNGD